MSAALTLARPYARAAFNAARDEGRIKAWSDALAFAARVAGDPQAQALLKHPQLTSEQAARLLAIDGEVKRIVTQLASRGFRSPYLRNYVAARINPVRFHKAKKGDKKPPMPLGAALTRMAASARKFNLESVRSGDLALVAAGAESQD
jgi:hypothetical protein